MLILDGKKIHQQIVANLQVHVEQLKKSNAPLKLVILTIIDHDHSPQYIKNKIKSCQSLGIDYQIIQYEQTINEKEILKQINLLNQDRSVTGILCQFPFPKHINEQNVIEAIDPKKDVDCFHPYNLGRLSAGLPISLPVTPTGIYQILNLSQIDVRGKHMVIIGRGNTVGKPLSILMSLKGMDATVTLCHSFTENIKKITRQADIVVAAFGEANTITSDFISPGCTIIDVGLNYIWDEETKKEKLVGDVDFNSVKNMASAITPVPGGVGPVTVAMLMFNTVSLAKLQHGEMPLSIF